MSFWKCTKLRNGSNPFFTVGKIYELDDSNNTIAGDGSYVFGEFTSLKKKSNPEDIYNISRI